MRVVVRLKDDALPREQAFDQQGQRPLSWEAADGFLSVTDSAGMVTIYPVGLVVSVLATPSRH